MARINEVAARPKLFWTLGAVLVVVIVGVVVGVAVLVGGSGDDSDGDRAISGEAGAVDDESASGVDADDRAGTGGASDGSDGPTGRTSDGGGEDDGGDARDGGDGSDGRSGPGATTGRGSSGDGATDPRSSSGGPRPGGSGAGDPSGGGTGTARDGELTSGQICDRVTGDVVARATGLDIVETSPADGSKTPQCRYYFVGADRSMTNATVSVLRPEEDMDGLSGAAAFRHAVESNRRAAASSGLEVSETDLGMGDESILFENELLRYGIIRYGDRIVTVILTAPSADHDAAVDLAGATSVLAPG